MPQMVQPSADIDAAHETKRLKELFELVDRDASGALSYEEFKAGIFFMGFLERRTDKNDTPGDEEMREWYDDADTDGSGLMGARTSFQPP